MAWAISLYPAISSEFYTIQEYKPISFAHFWGQSTNCTSPLLDISVLNAISKWVLWDCVLDGMPTKKKNEHLSLHAKLLDHFLPMMAFACLLQSQPGLWLTVSSKWCDMQTGNTLLERCLSGKRVSWNYLCTWSTCRQRLFSTCVYYKSTSSVVYKIMQGHEIHIFEGATVGNRPKIRPRNLPETYHYASNQNFL